MRPPKSDSLKPRIFGFQNGARGGQRAGHSVSRERDGGQRAGHSVASGRDTRPAGGTLGAGGWGAFERGRRASGRPGSRRAGCASDAERVGPYRGPFGPRDLTARSRRAARSRARPSFVIPHARAGRASSSTSRSSCSTMRRALASFRRSRRPTSMCAPARPCEGSDATAHQHRRDPASEHVAVEAGSRRSNAVGRRPIPHRPQQHVRLAPKRYAHLRQPVGDRSSRCLRGSEPLCVPATTCSSSVRTSGRCSSPITDGELPNARGPPAALVALRTLTANGAATPTADRPRQLPSTPVPAPW